MADFSTPDHHHISRPHPADRSTDGQSHGYTASELPQPSSDRVRFLRSFARCYTVLPSLQGPIASYIAN